MISVAMTTYNGGKYLLAQLTSIIHQTVPVAEIIICDDTSSDNTIAIIEQFIKNNNSSVNIKLIQNTVNLGYTKNFRKAIEHTHGDYIFLCDQDDIWEPNKVEHITKVMQQNNIDFVCSNYSLINQDGEPLQLAVAIPSFVQNAKSGLTKVKLFPLLFGNIAQGCTFCFTKNVKSVYLQTDSNDLIHDYQLILIAAIMKNCYFLNEKLIQYRIHDSNFVGLPQKKHIKKIRFHLHYYVPDLALFLKKLHVHTKIPYYHLIMPMIYLKIPVIYLFLRSVLSFVKK